MPLPTRQRVAVTMPSPQFPYPEVASRPGAEIGRVVGSEVRNFKRLEIGQAQAWHYHEDRALVLWECFLQDRYRSGDDPSRDLAHILVWQGLERSLLAHLQGVDRILTTWEDEYERPIWQRFLEAQGYKQIDVAAFAKAVP